MKKDEYINVLNQVIKQINHSWDLNTAQKEMMGLFGENIIPFGNLSPNFYFLAPFTLKSEYGF